MPKKKEKKAKPTKMDILQRHYSIGTDRMEIRMTRKNGWNDTINAYMNRVPTPWPFTARIMDPRIRTTILEKNGRLLNAKLQGQVTPREGGDIVKARVMNALLGYQWDNATDGGSMLEKIAMCDLYARIFGSAFVHVFWDTEKNCNEMKIVDPRDILFDETLTHVRSARGKQWIQVREWTTRSELEELGFEVPDLKANDTKESAYASQVLSNRSLTDPTYDPGNPRLEVVTEWTPTTETVFLPKYDVILRTRKNPYEHDRIPIAMLRYYPLPDDIFGESEVEAVMPLGRAINWFLSGFTDEMNQAIRPPHIVQEGQVKMETIEYGPNAIWIANAPNSIQEVNVGTASIQAFNNIYPALVAAFNTAMGSQSLGVSNIVGRGNDPKTATEVRSLSLQQNSRDQYNQLYLTEFLKDVMMMWVVNNQQYLFDDPTKHYHIIRVVGKDRVQELQELGLDQMDIPQELMDELSSQISQGTISPLELQRQAKESAIPTHPVILNPESPVEKYDVKPKLTVGQTGQDAELYLSKEDMDGVYDFIPDVVSMAAGSTDQRKKDIMEAIQTMKEFEVNLQQQGERLNAKEIISMIISTLGTNINAEKFFEPAQSPGTSGPQPGPGLNPMAGVPGVPPGSPPLAPPTGVSPMAGSLQGPLQGQAPPGLQ